MKLLVSGGSKTVAKIMATNPEQIGVLLTPRNGNREWWPEETVWACDNDCFQGLDAPVYMKMLARVAGFKTKPQWVACPDVVADAGATWSQWFAWRPILEQLALPAALILQDGIERLKWQGPLPSEWKRIDAVFVGGSTDWKLSEFPSRLTLEAHEQGKPCHWGRINSRRRIRFLIHEMKCGRCWVDSIDGSGFSTWSAIRIPKFLKWSDGAYKNHQPSLF